MDSVGGGCEDEDVRWNGEDEREGVGDVEFDQGQSAVNVLEVMSEAVNSGWVDGLYSSGGRLDGMADTLNASNGAWRLW